MKDRDSTCLNRDLIIRPINSYSNYYWSTGATQDHITIHLPGSYWLKVKDMNGCVGSDTIQVFSKNCFTQVFLPSVFTPNKDGHNDLFKATVFGNLVSFRLEIFDRSGQLIFMTTNYQFGWDGTFKGSPFSSAAFVWQCFYQLEGKLPEYQTGSVILMR